MKLKQVIFHCGIIVAAILIVYSKVFHAGFMSWDDLDYVFNTPDITAINGTTIAKWFSGFYIGNYQPLPMFSYAIDFMISGEHAVSYHVQNVVWHILCSLVVYFFTERLTGKKQVALMVTLLFAIHPVQTESVSWIAARNKMMNGFFFLSAMYLYLRYIKTGKRSLLIWTFMSGLLAYLCKSTAVMLPFALFSIDIWTRRPFRGRAIWLEKLPLILLAIPVGLITLQAQQEVAFLNLHPESDIIHTIIFAGYAYVQYLINLIFPFRLSVLYPYPDSISAIHILYAILASGIITLGWYAWRKKWYMLAGGVLFYTVNIVIVLQFVQFGEVLMADRYLYIACIGVWFPVVYYLDAWLLQKQWSKIWTPLLTVLCLGYGTVAFARNDIWMNEINFWTSVTDRYPESAIAQYSLGAAYLKDGDLKKAEQGINEAIKLAPDNYKAWYNKGVLEMRKGDAVMGLEALNKCIAIYPYGKALFTRALLYQQTGSAALALKDIDRFLNSEPYNARALYIKADCLEQMQQLTEAMVYYNKAIEADSKEPLYYLRRALAYAKMQQYEQALHDLDQAISLNANDGTYWYWRGLVRYRSGQSPCKDLHEALNRNYSAAREALNKWCR